jgi:hypothetical protein
VNEASRPGVKSSPPGYARLRHECFTKHIVDEVSLLRHDEEFMRRYKKWKRAKRKAAKLANIKGGAA